MEKRYGKDVETCMDDLRNIFIDAGKLCLKTKKKYKVSYNKDKLGFDGQCRKLKNEVLHLGKLVSKFPKDPLIHGKFISTKKAFKKLVKKKNWDAKNKLLDKICDSEKKNPKQFWRLLNKLKEAKANDSPISMKEWEEHFRGLLNTPIADRSDKIFPNLIKSKLLNAFQSEIGVEYLDNHFIDEEITDAIRSLKPGKAGGPDLILNDMLVAANPLLNSCLCKLFNLVLDTEQLPNPWSFGYLVPIFKKGDRLDTGNYRGLSIVSCVNKLFTKMLNTRLVNFLDPHNLMSCFQIGFVKKKRTSDHVFVLKCILEEAKSKKQAVFGCFVDLKKAYDTVWREGLFVKLLCQYSLSTKFVRLIKNMYSGLHGVVKVNNVQSDDIPLSIGLRQGCSLSPYLFNMYINDLPKYLERAECDPVELYHKKVGILMYADDMLLLSKSESGLKRALSVLSVYCKKWQLVVNVNKTKIIVFNKVRYNVKSFPYNYECIDVVKNYTYLGVNICNTGSFKKASKDLYSSALRAYFSTRSIGELLKPNISVKLFDTMVKPILLYCSDVIGGFGRKKVTGDRLFKNLMSDDKALPEKLNIRMCKQTLKLPKSASNLASRAELGRMPVMKSILVAICKYYARLHTFDEGDLLYYAVKSQKVLQNLSANGKFFTYSEFAEEIMRYLGIEMPSVLTKDSIFNLGCEVKETITKQFKEQFKSHLCTLNESKLSVYSAVKQDYDYEKYLNYAPDFKSMVRFRTSCHWLPIERGRYIRPIIPRNCRICLECKKAVGTEFHAMFKCSNAILLGIRNKHLENIMKICPALELFSDQEKFVYLLSCKDKDVTPIVCIWVKQINECFKPK